LHTDRDGANALILFEGAAVRHKVSPTREVERLVVPGMTRQDTAPLRWT
jgi:hypothetical protein